MDVFLLCHVRQEFKPIFQSKMYQLKQSYVPTLFYTLPSQKEQFFKNKIKGILKFDTIL